MTRLAPISPKKLCRVLEKEGFEAVRRKGSHVFYKHADGRATVVPFHKGEDIGRGLLRKIFRDVKWDAEYFNSLRK